MRAAAGAGGGDHGRRGAGEAKEIKEVKGAGFQPPKRRHDQPLRLEDLLDDDELAELKRRAEPAAEEVPSHRVVLESLPVQEGDGAAAVRSGTRLAGPGGAPARRRKANRPVGEISLRAPSLRRPEGLNFQSPARQHGGCP